MTEHDGQALTELEYERTARLLADRRALELEAKLYQLRLQQRMDEAAAAFDAHVEKLRKKYPALRDVRDFALDDHTRSLRVRAVRAATTGD